MNSEQVKLRILLLGVSPEFASALCAWVRNSEFVESDPNHARLSEAVEMLSSGKANCIFLNPIAFAWPPTQELLQFCTLTFPVCLVLSASELATLKDVPSSWRNRLREYYNILSDSAASELPNQLDYVVRGCHRYLLKRAIRTNVRQIATGTSPAGQLAVKVQEVEKALEAIDKTDRTELEVAMGLNATQMRALVDETLTHTRESLRRGQLANIAALSAGLFLVLATAISVFAGGDANIWTAATGGMGAAATIAALITAPRRNIENGASRLIYIQTAYFSFLTQIRLLGIPGEETTLQRSERLEAATAKLLDQMMAITKDGT